MTSTSTRHALAALATLLTTSAASAQTIGDPLKGYAYARTHCAECHNVERGTRMPSPDPKAPTLQQVALTPGFTSTALAVFFRTPHATMPNLVIEGEERDDLIAYILSLRSAC